MDGKITILTHIKILFLGALGLSLIVWVHSLAKNHHSCLTRHAMNTLFRMFRLNPGLKQFRGHPLVAVHAESWVHVIDHEFASQQSSMVFPFYGGNSSMLKIKRIYDAPAQDDGFRILVDRLWPRGLTKEKAKLDLWLKEIAPSDQLRKWYAHDPKKWADFREKYFKDLSMKSELVSQIVQKMKEGNVTLLYSSKEEKLNNAVALKEYIEK